MSAAWAGVALTGMGLCAALGAVVAKLAYRAGRVEEAIDRLSRIAERQDNDIRQLQRTRR